MTQTSTFSLCTICMCIFRCTRRLSCLKWPSILPHVFSTGLSVFINCYLSLIFWGAAHAVWLTRRNEQRKLCATTVFMLMAHLMRYLLSIGGKVPAVAGDEASISRDEWFAGSGDKKKGGKCHIWNFAYQTVYYYDAFLKGCAAAKIAS